MLERTFPTYCIWVFSFNQLKNDSIGCLIDETALLYKDSKAKSLSNINELLDDYSWKIEEKNINNKYTQNQLLILNSLSSEKNLDNILMETKIEQTEILAELMTLEIMGVIKSITGGRYKKIL